MFMDIYRVSGYINDLTWPRQGNDRIWIDVIIAK
jgi:hypothetical protein